MTGDRNQAGPQGHGRRRHPRRDLAGDRPRQERQLDLAERPRRSTAISQQALARDVRVANDANCFALSEATDGAGRGKRVVFGVILGTGVGGGIVVDGKVLTGPNAIAGEWGHNPLPWPDADETPGPAMLLRQVAAASKPGSSGPALQRLQGRPASDKRRRIAGAQQGDADAKPSSRAYERRLAKALAHLVNILDPDIIVLGGGLSNLDRLYTNVQPQIAQLRLLRRGRNADRQEPLGRLQRRARRSLAVAGAMSDALPRLLHADGRRRRAAARRARARASSITTRSPSSRWRTSTATPSTPPSKSATTRRSPTSP